MRNTDRAEEITQAVFAILAKKAAQLRHDKALPSWLFQTTRLMTSNLVRREGRRHRRQQEAHMQSVLNESGGEVWPGIASFLDDAVAALNETDRHAVMLRFYPNDNGLRHSRDCAIRRRLTATNWDPVRILTHSLSDLAGGGYHPMSEQSDRSRAPPRLHRP